MLQILSKASGVMCTVTVTGIIAVLNVIPETYSMKHMNAAVEVRSGVLLHS